MSTTYKVMEGNSKDKASIKKTKKTLSKEARMIIMLTRFRQSEQEYTHEQTNLIDSLREARNSINDELNILKEDINVKDSSESEERKYKSTEEKAETKDMSKLEDRELERKKPKMIVDPNRELLKKIKEKATSRIDTGVNKVNKKSSNLNSTTKTAKIAIKEVPNYQKS